MELRQLSSGQTLTLPDDLLWADEHAWTPAVASTTYLITGALLWWITPFTPLQSAGMAAVIVIMGFLGGLVMSAIKRSLGAKDWGNMIEGHGGMLDRMDSVSFAAPIFFHLVRYFFTA